MKRLESCPLNKTCEKTDDPFYKRRADLKSCNSYARCQILSAAVRIPILRHYDSCGGYWKVDTSPTICEWSDYVTRYPSNISYCPIRFFSSSHIEIGSVVDRDLPLPNQYQESLTLENLVAMEIKQTYHQMGFFEAVPKTPKTFTSNKLGTYDWDLRL